MSGHSRGSSRKSPRRQRAVRDQILELGRVKQLVLEPGSALPPLRTAPLAPGPAWQSSGPPVLRPAGGIARTPPGHTSRRQTSLGTDSPRTDTPRTDTARTDIGRTDTAGTRLGRAAIARARVALPSPRPATGVPALPPLPAPAGAGTAGVCAPSAETGPRLKINNSQQHTRLLRSDIVNFVRVCSQMLPRCCPLWGGDSSAGHGATISLRAASGCALRGGR